MTELSPVARGFYRTLRLVLLGFSKVWFRIEVTGAENLPASGGFVVAPGGHRSILDTPVVALGSGRMLRYMGAEKYFEIPGFGWFLRSVGGFPVERGIADREALRLSEQILEAGDPLVVFPESTRFEGPLVQELKEGAAFMACRTGVPLVPIGIGGAERAFPKGARFLKPSKVTLVIGEPLFPPIRESGGRVKRSQVKALTSELHETLQELFDEAQLRAGI